jgi:hypothetical protein
MVVPLAGFTSASAKLPCVRVVVDETLVEGKLLFTIQPSTVSKPMTGLIAFGGRGGRGIWAAALPINAHANMPGPATFSR